MTNDKLNALLKEAKKARMSERDLEEQRQSFAYGNANIENERVSRETVAQAAQRLKKEESSQ